MTSLVLLITWSFIGCYIMHTVLYSVTLPYFLFMDRFLKRAAPSNRPPVAPSAKRPAPVAKQGHVTAFILTY